ncbi:MAG: hypothetical protein PVI90_03950, partial [Desulfobacteraceae bacterium]
MQNNTITQKKIAIDRMQRLTAQTSIGISATLINSIILSLALLTVLPHSKVFTWLSVVFTVSGLRLLIHRRFQKSPINIENVDQRKNTLLFLLGVSGCIWGSLPIFLFPPNSIVHQVLIVFVLGGMVAGSVGVFASIMAVFYAYSIPTVIPMLVVL